MSVSVGQHLTRIVSVLLAKALVNVNNILSDIAASDRLTSHIGVHKLQRLFQYDSYRNRSRIWPRPRSHGETKEAWIVDYSDQSGARHIKTLRPQSATPKPITPSARRASAVRRCGRLFAHDTIYNDLVRRLSRVYASVKVGDPREAGTLVGPLIDRRAFDSMQRALEEAREAGGILHGGKRIEGIRGREHLLRASRALRDAGAYAWSRDARNLCVESLCDALFRTR